MMSDSWRKDDERNTLFYTERIKRHGIDVRSLDWGSRESQRLRFSVLAQVGPLNTACILDVGCGMGDFFSWLKEKGVQAQYTGIDITPKMIEIARRQFPDASFEVTSLLEYANNVTQEYDYVIASGIFTHRTTGPVEFLKESARQMYNSCKKGVSFNCLSIWAPLKEQGEFYADPLETVSFCRSITPWVVLRHDYLPHDFTIYMYREQQQ